jgi:hypothetical protein
MAGKLQTPFEHSKGKGIKIVPPSPGSKSSTRHTMDLKMKQGFNHLAGIFFDERDGIPLAKKDKRREVR